MSRNKEASSIVTVMVRVTPRADRNATIGVREDGIILLRTTAAPVDGKANAACVELLADCFGVRRGQVVLLSGATGRDKRFSLEGTTPAKVEERLQGLHIQNQDGNDGNDYQR